LWDGFDKPITLLTNKELNIPVESIGLKGSPTRVKKTFTKPVTKKSKKQVLPPEEAARVIIDALDAQM
jgi:electron transfer flavoprotein beta subunit